MGWGKIRRSIKKTVKSISRAPESLLKGDIGGAVYNTLSATGGGIGRAAAKQLGVAPQKLPW